MKFIKLIIASLMLVAGFAQAGAFVNNATVPVPATLDNVKSVNLYNLLKIEYDPSTRTIVFTPKNGVLATQWTFSSNADYNFVLDKFLANTLLFYTSIYGTNAHSLIPISSVLNTECKQPDLGVQFFQVKLTLSDGSIVNSNGYSVSQCAVFNP